MQTKSATYCLFLAFLLHVTNLFTEIVFAQNQRSEVFDHQDLYIHSLSSLVFHAQEWEKDLNLEQQTTHEGIDFSDEEISLLWEKIGSGISKISANQIQRICDFNEAFQEYAKAKEFADSGFKKEAQKAVNTCVNLLRLLWEEAIENEYDHFGHLHCDIILRRKNDPNVENNPHLPKKAKKRMEPYLLPLNHRMRSVLDNLCLKKRVTADEEAFSQAGFKIISERPRSFIRVASHPKMRGYLVKVYLDTVLDEKSRKPSWEWLARRCEGAKKISRIIKKRQTKHFVVATKWIYCLPPEPSPPDSSLYTRHLALLLVTNMDLVSKRKNLHAWRHSITPEHLDELYAIISRAKGSSYRPDNIAYTHKEQFAFIDTEYPSRGPDYKSIRHYLNSDMRDYWEHIVKNGGS